MPVTLAELKANIRTVAVPYHEMTVIVKYRPSQLTPQNSSEIAERVERGEAKNLVIETLCTALVSWDIVDDTGEMYPITPESLAQLDGALLLAISEAIGQDSLPKPKSAGRSFAR